MNLLSQVNSMISEGRFSEVIAAMSRKTEADLRTRDGMDALAAVYREKGREVLTNYIKYLLDSAEPMKALKVIDECCPSTIEDCREVADLKAFIGIRLPHVLKGWEAYRKVYNDLPAEEGSFEISPGKLHDYMNMGRTKGVLKWAKDIEEGMALTVMSIGFQNGIIERWLLETNKLLTLTCVDCIDASEEAAKKLAEDFPGRVFYHSVKKGMFDWPDRFFDCVICLEVLEHVPSAEGLLKAIFSHMTPGSTLLLSTPVADRWVESHLSDPENAPNIYYHVSSRRPLALLELFNKEGFYVDTIETTDLGRQFFVEARAQTKAPWDQPWRRESQASLPVIEDRACLFFRDALYRDPGE